MTPAARTVPQIDSIELLGVSCNRLLDGGRVAAERCDEQANEQHRRVKQHGQNSGEVKAELTLGGPPKDDKEQEGRCGYKHHEIQE